MSRTNTKLRTQTANGGLMALIALALVTTSLSGGAGSPGMTDESPGTIESQLADSVRNCTASVVRIYCGTEKGTGCFVTADGYLLTAVHVVAGHPRDRIRIRLADATLQDAAIIRRDVDNDLAVLRIEPPDRTTVSRTDPVVIAESVPTIGTLVFAAGFPGWLAEDVRSPTFRLGAVVAVHHTLMRSGCKLTTGDSGGPLFDLDGHLVGISLQIGNRSDDNVHRTLPAIVRILKDAGVSPDATAPTTAIPFSRLTASGAEKAERTLAALRVTLHPIDAEDQRDEQTASAIGTLWDSQTIVSKLSLLTATSYRCRIAEEQLTTAVLLRTDPGRDLAVLRLTDPARVPEHLLPGRAPASSKLPGDRSAEFTARLVCSEADGHWGVISSDRHQEPTSKAVLGMSLKRAGGGLLIDRVEKDAPADRVKLRPGDQIVRAGKHAEGLSVMEQLTETMRGVEPGNRVAITVLRGSQEIDVLLQADPPASEVLDRDRFLDGRAGRLSQRRTGFRDVIRHDATVAPSECGGPLVDTSGRLIGVNIARASRESMFAVPADQLRQIVQDNFTAE